jgi:hypothetical protein
MIAITQAGKTTLQFLRPRSAQNIISFLCGQLRPFTVIRAFKTILESAIQPGSHCGLFFPRQEHGFVALSDAVQTTCQVVYVLGLFNRQSLGFAELGFATLSDSFETVL